MNPITGDGYATDKFNPRWIMERRRSRETERRLIKLQAQSTHKTPNRVTFED
jgi:hypothetical protein